MIEKSLMIILFSLVFRLGLTQENQFQVKTVDLCVDLIDLSNDSLQQVLHNRIKEIVKRINHEIFTHNFSNDTLYCPSFSGAAVMLFTFTINNENKIEKYEVVATKNCENFNQLLTTQIMKLEGEYLGFNQYENKIRLVITIDKTIGWVEFFEIY
jgi:hypothetical protein